MAAELGVSEEALWVENNPFTGTMGNKLHLFLWTKHMTDKQIAKITASSSGGGLTSMRGNIYRLLEEFHADGWLTRVKPTEAGLKDLHPISPLTANKDFCYCGGKLITSDEARLGKCFLHLPRKQ